MGSAIVKKLHSKNQAVVSIDIIEDKEISKISSFYKIDISDKNLDYKNIFKDVCYFPQSLY